jgi:Glycosyl hydrolases family 16
VLDRPDTGSMPTFTVVSARRAIILALTALVLLAASLVSTSSALAATRKTNAAERSHRTHAHKANAVRAAKKDGKATRKAEKHHKAHAKKTTKKKHVAKRHVAKKPTAKKATASAANSTDVSAPTLTASAASGDALATIGLPSTSPSTGPSGAAMPTGNLPGWNQVFSDDFTTDVPLGSFSGCTDGATVMTSNCSGLPASVSSQLWAYPDGWKDTSGNGTYAPSQVLSIHGGELDYNIHSSNGSSLVSAVVPKIPGGPNGNGLQYGAYAIRFRSDSLPGYKTAFMLWPDSNTWPLDGEVDFPEGNLDGTMNAYMHQQGATSGSQQSAYSTNASYTSWHTAVIEWTPTSCRFILDGQVVGNSVSLVPNTPMHWVLQAETALTGQPASSVAGHLDIDWIAAYQQA